MKNFLQAISAAFLAIGFFSPFLADSISYINWINAMVLSGVFLSLALGKYWHLKLNTKNIRVNSNFNQEIESFLRSEIFWLQGIRPKFKLTDAKQWMTKSSAALVGENCATLFIFAILVVAIGFLYMPATQINSAGIFGSLLDTQAGKGLATSFALYLLLSSASTFSLGLFCKLSAEDSQ